MKKTSSIISASLAVLMLCFSTSNSQTYPITQLIHDDYSDKDPMINDLGHIVWWGRTVDDDYSSSEIFIYDGSTLIQLTDNDEYNQYPQINDSDHIVCQGFRVNFLGPNESSQIFYAVPSNTGNATGTDAIGRSSGGCFIATVREKMSTIL